MNKIIKTMLKLIIILFVYISLFALGLYQARGLTAFLVLIILLFIFKTRKIYNKQFFYQSVIISLIYSTIDSYGLYYQTLLKQNNSNVILNLIVNFILLYFTLINLLPILYNYKIKKDNKEHKNIFLISFVVILIGYTIYLLNFYPGIASYDTCEQLHYVLNNFNGITNHHPILHTLFMALPFKIGLFLTNNITISMLLITISQMIVMSLIFSSFIKYLYIKKVNTKIIYTCIFIFALCPNFGYMSICLWKDIIFSGLMLLLTMSLVDICDSDKISKKSLMLFAIISLLTVLFRNNAIYMYILLTFFIMILLKDKRKVLGITCTSIIALYFIIVGPLFKLIGIKSTEIREYLSIPLQQIGRMSEQEVQFTDYEKELISKVIDIEKLKRSYQPLTSDPIKFNADFHEEPITNNKYEYLKLYVVLVKKYPEIARDAYLTTMIGYYYIGFPSINIQTNNYNYQDEFNINEKSLIPHIDELLLSEGCPIIALLYSCCLGYFVIIVFNYLCIKKRNIKYLIPYIPTYGIWLTIFLASPSACEYRYVFSQYTCLLLLVLLPYLDDKKRSK